MEWETGGVGAADGGSRVTGEEREDDGCGVTLSASSSRRSGMIVLRSRPHG